MDPGEEVLRGGALGTLSIPFLKVRREEIRQGGPGACVSTSGCLDDTGNVLTGHPGLWATRTFQVHYRVIGLKGTASFLQRNQTAIEEGRSIRDGQKCVYMCMGEGEGDLKKDALVMHEISPV